MIRYQIEPDLHVDEFIDCLVRSTLAERRPISDRSAMQRMLEHADLICTARHDALLVGIARSLAVEPELWFLDEDAKNVAFASPAAKALPEDEKNFLKGITIFGVEESVVLAGQGDVKVLVLRRSDDVPVPAEDALGWCRDLLQAVPAARACILNRVLTSEHRPGVWHEQDPPDLIVEFRFESAEVAAEAIGRESFQTFLGAQPDGMTVAAYLIEVRTII